jgi:prevent-host-death family protein
MDAIGPISEVRAHLPEVVDLVRKKLKRYVITRQGKPVAIVLSPEELETLEILADARLIRSLIRAEADIKAGRLYTHKEIFGA